MQLVSTKAGGRSVNLTSISLAAALSIILANVSLGQETQSEDTPTVGRGANDEQTKEEAAKFEEEVMGREDVIKAREDVIKKLTAILEARLLEREKQVQELSRQLAESERIRALPAMEDGEIKVFSLRSVKAPEAATTLESLFGAQIRVAIDERTNALIVFGKGNALQAVEALLLRLDQSDSASPRGDAARSPLLRVFWLADGLPKGEGQDPQKFLPAAVVKATERLGLEAPRLVTQTVNSLALGQQPAVPFSTQVPAMVFNQPANLTCKGQMRSVDGDRAAVDIEIQVTGPSINCQLSGSLATPLGHYMVLGTANSVIGDPAMMAGMGMMGGYGGGYGGRGGYGGEGMGRPGGYGGEGGRMGYGGGMGYGRGGYGGEGIGIGREVAAAEEERRRLEEDEERRRGEREVGAESSGEEQTPNEQPAEPKYATSRFAFVVQVIEGESYAATTPSSKSSGDASRDQADNDPFK